MGGQQAWRTLLMNLMPHCFFAQLPAERRCFDCVMVDFMQYVASRVVGSRDDSLDIESVARRVEQVAAFFINNEDDQDRPHIRRMLVAMLDTVQDVPKNKSGTQRTRDGDEGGHMDEAMYQQLCAECPPLLGSLFVTTNPHGHRYRIPGKRLWRTTSLKMQLFRVLTFRLLHTRIEREDCLLMVDGGIAFSLAEYQAYRERVIKKHQYEKHSAFEQECLVTERLLHSKKMGFARFMVWSDGNHHRFPSTGIGEADIKIQAYINRENGFKHFLVVNQDTDIIFILLLHMHTFLYHDERDEELEVWLDTRCPSDKQPDRPYRYIDIKRLYQSIVRLFAAEYPHVAHPVQTFCFLVFSLETDFTRKFHPCLRITPSLVWNTFSELHHYDVQRKDFIKYSQSPNAGDQTVRCNQRTLSPALYGMLDMAVSYDCVGKRFFFRHSHINRFFYLLCQMRIVAVRRDLGLGAPADNRVIEAIEPEEVLIYATDISERLEYYRKHALKQTTLHDCQINQLKRQMERHDHVMADTPPPALTKPRAKAIAVTPKFMPSGNGWMKPNKQYKPATTTTTTTTTVSEEIEDLLDGITARQLSDDAAAETAELQRIQRISDIVNTRPGTTNESGGITEAYIRQYERKLAELSKIAEGTGSHFAVPNLNDMLARIYRIEWYISYCADGWRTPGPYGALNCVARARHNPAQSEWGWREIVLTDQAEITRAMNSTYYISHYNKQWKPGEPVFRWSMIEETNEVSHRRVYRSLV